MFSNRRMGIAVACTLEHGAVRVLGILARLVFVEGIEDLADQVALGVLP